MTLQSLGKSYENRDLYAVTVANVQAAAEPAIVIVGGLDANDLDGSEICLHVLQNICDDDNPDMQKLLSSVTFYVLPRINPDACEAKWQEVQYERELNADETDLDHDGFVSEDGYEDLNDDGMITMMRVFDSAGAFIPDPDEPRLMRRADPLKGENGLYKIYTEGVDNDGDGLFNEDESGGVALNKNFSFAYQSHARATGPFAVSEKETRAIADFCFRRKNIAAVISFADDGNLVNMWPATQEWNDEHPLDKMLQRDADYLLGIAADWQITGTARSVAGTPQPGDLARWVYFHYGRWSLSAPVWSLPESKDSTLTQEDSSYKEKLLLQWIDENDPDRFVAWQNITHPDFPNKQVQVGGFVPFAALAPADSLDRIAARFTNFLSVFSEKLPTLKLDVDSEKLADHVIRITATIHNTGFLPTNTVLAEKVQWLEKVRVEIELPKGAQLAGGQTLEIIPQINGGAGVEKSWVVSGRLSSEITIRVGSPSCGFIEKHIMR